MKAVRVHSRSTTFTPLLKNIHQSFATLKITLFYIKNYRRKRTESKAKAEMPRQNKSIFIWLKIRGRHRYLQLLKLQSVLIRPSLHIFKYFNH